MNPSDPPPPSLPDDHWPVLSDALGWNECDVVTERDMEEAARLEESVAAAILTAPRQPAPAGCLAAIRSKIAAPAAFNGVKVNGASLSSEGHATGPRTGLSAVKKSTGVRPQKRTLQFAGWGLAAALAMVAGWQTLQSVHLRNELNTVRSQKEKNKDGKGSDHTDTELTSGKERGPASQREGRSGNRPALPGRDLKARSRNFATSSLVVPDRPALMRRLEELQRLEKARFEAAPGLARTVVMELRQPGAKPNTPARTVMLSDEVAGLIAAGIDKSAPAGSGMTADKPPVQFSGTDKDRPADDLFIKEGLPNFAGFTLKDGVTLFHENFPADNWQEWSGLHLLKDGTFYDDLNDILWKPVPGEGRRYAGTKPQEPIILDDQAVPPGTPAPAQPPAVPEVKNDTDQGPLIWSIYDESRGEGRFVVSGLSPAPEGQAYQVWFEDARGTAPVTAGLLPALDEGAGQVGFSLTPGISPVRYRITLEPAGGSAQPLGPVILTGP